MIVPRFVLRSLQVAGVLLFALTSVPSVAQGRFTVSTDGQEVLDTSTNLVWRRCPEGMKWDGTACAGKALALKLAEAKTLVADADKTEAKNWRIPFKEELMGLVDRTQKKKPKIDTSVFPGTPSTLFWALRPGFNDNLNAYLVNFASGKVYGNEGERKNNLRLVRLKD